MVTEPTEAEHVSVDMTVCSQCDASPIKCTYTIGFAFVAPRASAPTPTRREGMVSERKGVDPLFPPTERKSWDFLDWSAKPTLQQARQEAEKSSAEIDRLRADLAEAESWAQTLTKSHGINMQIARTRAERAEADLAAAREVIEWALDEIDTHDGEYHHVTNIAKRNEARAFLERTTAAPAAPLSPTPPK